jgi:hypothetical protein
VIAIPLHGTVGVDVGGAVGLRVMVEVIVAALGGV